MWPSDTPDPALSHDPKEGVFQKNTTKMVKVPEVLLDYVQHFPSPKGAQAQCPLLLCCTCRARLTEAPLQARVGPPGSGSNFCGSPRMKAPGSGNSKFGHTSRCNHTSGFEVFRRQPVQACYLQELNFADSIVEDTTSGRELLFVNACLLIKSNFPPLQAHAGRSG